MPNFWAQIIACAMGSPFSIDMKNLLAEMRIESALLRCNIARARLLGRPEEMV